MIIGIDLGTTNSAVAFLNNDRAEIIENRDGERITPSAVSIDIKDGKTISIGKHARDALLSTPDYAAIEVKRLMGTEQTVKLGDQTYRPEEISAMILRELKTYAEERFGQTVTEAVITVPAYFSDAQRKATQKAGELAGLKVERILNEPTAAAIAYGMNNLDKEQNILVYDLGGGTFDVSVVEIFEGILEVKASAGNNHLGGMDFDNAIVDWLVGKVKKEEQIDLLSSADLKTRNRLKMEAEKVKKALSSQVTTRIDLPFIGMKDGVPFNLITEISRIEFEQIIKEMVLSTLDEVDKALNDAELSITQIDEVLLVGGSTRIPLVQELVAKVFGKSPRKDVNPDEAIALGAAIQAGIKSGQIDSQKGIMVTDVCPFTLGTDIVKVIGGQYIPGFFDPIIPRNCTIPITQSKTYYTVNDGQTEVNVRVYQGEEPYAEKNIFLAELEITDIPEGAAGKEAIEVTFQYDINGNLQVEAKIVSTGKKVQQLITDQAGVMSESEVVAAKERLNVNWEQSDLYKDVKAVVYRAEKMLKEVNDGNRAKIESLLHQLKSALSLNDASQVKRLEEDLTDLLIELV